MTNLLIRVYISTLASGMQVLSSSLGIFNSFDEIDHAIMGFVLVINAPVPDLSSLTDRWILFERKSTSNYCKLFELVVAMELCSLFNSFKSQLNWPKVKFLSIISGTFSRKSAIFRFHLFTKDQALPIQGMKVVPFCRYASFSDIFSALFSALLW